MTEQDYEKEVYSTSDWVLLFFKGVTMGAADMVPGVSGGTIAFISGIYDRLIDALKTLTPFALKVLFQQGFLAFWYHIDGRFLLTLFSGVILSVLSFARVISFSLDSYPILVWSFFFGLVVASVIYLISQITRWRWKEVLALGIGSLIALALTSLRPVELTNEWWMVMSAGAVAICAMILPGISGSFILLLMGMYSVIIDALESLDVLLLSSFTLGCLLGLLAFSHILSWLMHRYHTIMYSVLIGFLVGSLNLLWPWKQTLELAVDRHGEYVPLVQTNVLPHVYTDLTGETSMLMWSLLCALFGLVLVLLLERIGNKRH